MKESLYDIASVILVSLQTLLWIIYQRTEKEIGNTQKFISFLK